jgi:dedicated sortase system histidine kinase
MIGKKLAFAIADIDDPKTHTIKTVIGTAGTGKPNELGSIMLPMPEMEKLLQGLKNTDGRIWIIDSKRRVLALSGSIRSLPGKQQDKGLLKGIMHAIYRIILKQPVRNFVDDLSAASTLNGEEVRKALAGKATLRWRQSPDRRITIMSAAQPIWHDKKVIGAVVMERTSNSILILQNQAMENLFNLSLLVFLIATIVLLFFATRLSGRVMRLRNDAENAIGPDGRVQGQISGSSAGDEIGDLSRSFSDMLDRLSQYTRYLESMASKLSHELRTPLTVVRSSLDNLEMTGQDDDTRVYTRRAQEGLNRLANILHRMSEATRLEQSIQQAETEIFDLREVIHGCVEGYRSAYPDKTFEYQAPTVPLPIRGMPELLAQMLDKLVSNAIDFSLEDTSIIVRLDKSDHTAAIQVENSGPCLPQDMANNLFDSMVSVRETHNEEPHLGLGLHIVRLISDFHHGHASASNRETQDGVVFNISLPLSDKSA